MGPLPCKKMQGCLLSEHLTNCLCVSLSLCDSRLATFTSPLSVSSFSVNPYVCLAIVYRCELEMMPP